MSKSKSAKTLAADRTTPDLQRLPPYGYMNEHWMYDVRTRRVPVGFRVGGAPANEAVYIKWLEGTVDDIAQFLWPRFDQSTGTWVGSAAATAWELTEVDLDLMRTLRTKLTERAPCRDPSLAESHKSFFLVEDTESMPDTVFKYESALPASTAADLKTAIGKGLGEFGPAPLRFKEYFQRPRPYQTAFILNREFAYEWAKSAVSPALISGHAIQGVIAGTRGYVSCLRTLALTAGATENLMQWCIDVGDRRVFAGVHYPSDNLASWYIALLICDNYVFGELRQEARAFIAEAIRRSAVYQAVKACVGAGQGAPYVLAMAKLKGLGV
jgi:PAP2 superfamily